MGRGVRPAKTSENLRWAQCDLCRMHGAAHTAGRFSHTSRWLPIQPNPATVYLVTASDPTGQGIVPPPPTPITAQTVTVLLIYQLQLSFPRPSPWLQFICWSSSQNSEKHFLMLPGLL